MEALGDHGGNRKFLNGNGVGADRKEIAARLSREITSKITPDEKRKMESDGGIDKNELKAVLSKSNIKPSAEIAEKFNELDTNKNGKLEESEISSTTKGGKDYFFPGIIGVVVSTMVPILIKNLPEILEFGAKIVQEALNQQE